MSQEEHILHVLKEMREWTANADKQMARIKWSLYGLTTMFVVSIILLLLK
ncbi:MAG: hypothetical protein WCY36_02900 [Candidatus Omnitrophota bacterium]